MRPATRSIRLLLILACATVALASSNDKAWQEDLTVLAKELPARHKNLFFRLTRQQFDAEVRSLAADIPKLSDPQIRVRFMRLVALVGDNHTQATGFPQISAYAISLYEFPDGTYVVSARKEYSQTVGTRLVAIGELPLTEAKKRVATLVAPENEVVGLTNIPQLIHYGEILNALDILQRPDEGAFTFENAKGERFSMTLSVAGAGEKIEFVSKPAGIDYPLPLYRSGPQADYWFRYIPESKLLYVQYNQCRNHEDHPFAEFTKEVMAAAGQNQVDRFVIDLRRNGGGNSAIFDPMLNAIGSRESLKRQGVLFCVIGRGTYSSAYLNAFDLQKKYHAILVGEPTGQKPNHYGEVRTFTLPNSRMTISHATKHFQTLPPADGDPPTMVPDITAIVKASDYFSGQDPVLDAILHYGQR